MKKNQNKCLFYRYKDFSIYVCSFFILLFLIILIFTFFFVKFNFCYRYNGFVLKEGDDFYVHIMASDNWISKLQNIPLVIEKKYIDYEVIKIGDEYVLTDSGLKREVLFKFNIDDDKKIVNNVLELCFLRKMTFFNKIKEMFI